MSGLGLDPERVDRIEKRMEAARGRALASFEAKWTRDFWRAEKAKLQEREKRKRARARARRASAAA
ncbi:MAG: hypothetical protein QNJ87_12165 [Gammaproteobacteria bacterium]|nr:hypothetical protein [Gammaproteobacteria bacterium]